MSGIHVFVDCGEAGDVGQGWIVEWEVVRLWVVVDDGTWGKLVLPLVSQS